VNRHDNIFLGENIDLGCPALDRIIRAGGTFTIRFYKLEKQYNDRSKKKLKQLNFETLDNTTYPGLASNLW
jgi:hypothetical protein